MDNFSILSAVSERVRSERQSAALATVINCSGSTPQNLGARMALFEDGTQVGTIGGGAIEQDVTSVLRGVLCDRTALCHTRHLTRDLGMCCGGSMSFFIEPITPPPRLVLFGAGHVCQPTASIARAAGFIVLVVDERDEWNNIARFPDCERIVDDGTDALKSKTLRLGADDYVVICTYSHRLDETLVALCAKQCPRYLGMIGSRRKAELIRTRILAQFPDTNLDHLRSPIGLHISARDPGEIAVAIIAELVSVRRNQPETASRPARSPHVLGVVLAAGASSRLGYAKALACLDGQSVLMKVHQALLAGGCSEVCVVVGPPHASAIRSAHPQFWYETNQQPERGMLSSFHVGLKAAHLRGADQVVVATLDQPRVSTNTVRALLAYAQDLPHCYVVPTFQGSRGHPFVVDTDLMTSEDPAAASLRDLLRERRKASDVEVDDPFVLDDLDTKEHAAKLGITSERWA